MAKPRIRVLLADDSEMIRRAMANFLKAFPDIEIAGEASSGSVAVELARLLVPDVVVMDVVMPGMNGIEATRVIHSDLPQVAIVGLSLSDEADYSHAMRKAGAVDFISKMAPPMALLAAIRTCVQMPRS
jgi:NarL family two-component system response regulator LiaR